MADNALQIKLDGLAHDLMGHMSSLESLIDSLETNLGLPSKSSMKPFMNEPQYSVAVNEFDAYISRRGMTIGQVLQNCGGPCYVRQRNREADRNDYIEWRTIMKSYGEVTQIHMQSQTTIDGVPKEL